jgi:hypothetical protein
VHQAARWVLLRALEAVPPARYVAGVVQVARSLEAAVAWTAAAELVEQMLRPCGPRVEQLAAV